MKTIVKNTNGSKAHVIVGHRVYKLDSGGTRVAARVSERGAGLPASDVGFLKARLVLHAWPCAATYGGPAGFPRRMCTRVRNTRTAGERAIVVNRTIRSHATYNGVADPAAASRSSSRPRAHTTHAAALTYAVPSAGGRTRRAFLRRSTCMQDTKYLHILRVIREKRDNE